jgi:peptidoglycan/xylan/chitin deacetylase (PgdA/CDA1 family)
LHKLYLTFDTEDFISLNSIFGLTRVLKLLKKYHLKGFFFITGHMAEKLECFPEVVDLFDEHLIGYHSSSHSVHPAIFEFTDLDNFKQAFSESIKRETAHINPLTGETEGEGGLISVRSVFPAHNVVAFRAPGHCWTPPHLEALKSLGIKYDFSAYLSPTTLKYKGLFFYPYPLIGHWHGKVQEYKNLILSLRHIVSVLTIHPSLMVNKLEWDLIYHGSNPEKLIQPSPLNVDERDSQFLQFELLLKRLNILRDFFSLEITPPLTEPKETLSLKEINLEKCYQKSVKWAKLHNYKPKYLLKHFNNFFS